MSGIEIFMIFYCSIYRVVNEYFISNVIAPAYLLQFEAKDFQDESIDK